MTMEADLNKMMIEEISDALNVAVADRKRATERAQRAEAALRAAEPYVETLHSLITSKPQRAQVWGVLKEMRQSIPEDAASPQPREAS